MFPARTLNFRKGVLKIPKEFLDAHPRLYDHHMQGLINMLREGFRVTLCVKGLGLKVYSPNLVLLAIMLRSISIFPLPCWTNKKNLQVFLDHHGPSR